MIYKIMKDGKEINNIVADEAFVTDYCQENGYTFEAMSQPEPVLAPTQLDIIEAQITYTAMMTDTLLGG